MRREKLEELLPGLKIERDKTIQEASEEIDKNKDKGFKLKAQYILFARDLNIPYQRARDTQDQFLTACHSVGVHEFYRDFINLPRLNIVSTYEGLHASLAPTKDEILDAYTHGQIPHFVKLYEMTGDILGDADARKILEKMQKEAKVNG